MVVNDSNMASGSHCHDKDVLQTTWCLGYVSMIGIHSKQSGFWVIFP